MLDLFAVGDEMLNKGTQLLRDELKSRGWKAQLAYSGSPHCFIDRGDGKTLHIFATTPPNTSYAAAHMANDKYATYQALLSTHAPQPETVVADEGTLQDALSLMAKHGKVVVKPSDAGHGKGITVGVNSEPALVAAVSYAKGFNRSARFVVVQQQFEYPATHDLRLTCIGYTFIGAVHREPAFVIADGNHTVTELIEAENASQKRGQPYFAPLATIDIDRARAYLGDDADKVLRKGTKVQVMSIANYGAGGEIHDVTDTIPGWMKRIAEEVSRAMELPVCGVDFMTDVLPDLDTTQDQMNAMIIEVNKAPSLAMHDAPTTGKSRGAVAAYVDYLATL